MSIAAWPENNWQWTDEFQNEHTRAAIVRGGGHYRPIASKRYFSTTTSLDKHGKCLPWRRRKIVPARSAFDASSIGEIVVAQLCRATAFCSYGSAFSFSASILLNMMSFRRIDREIKMRNKFSAGK